MIANVDSLSVSDFKYSRDSIPASSLTISFKCVVFLPRVAQRYVSHESKNSFSYLWQLANMLYHLIREKYSSISPDRNDQGSPTWIITAISAQDSYDRNNTYRISYHQIHSPSLLSMPSAASCIGLRYNMFLNVIHRNLAMTCDKYGLTQREEYRSANIRDASLDSRRKSWSIEQSFSAGTSPRPAHVT